MSAAVLDSLGKGNQQPSGGERRSDVTKAEFIERVAARRGVSKREAAAIVEDVLETISDALGDGDDVSLPGFGKFSVRHRPERSGVNPRNGERVRIPDGRVPKFAPGSALRAAVSR